MQMKTISLTVLAAIGVTTAAFGRIGEDEKQIEARYGKAGKVLGDHGNVHEVGYMSDGFMILVDFVNGISLREGFAKPDTSALTDVAVLQILALSAAEGTNWEPAPPGPARLRQMQTSIRSDPFARPYRPAVQRTKAQGHTRPV